ncbi:DUF4062 domain-containing protein [Methylomonas albis]|uniref:DUF4062 domain-containing protein n=1 Tax=Methylomonas albis TaxID=1854563 RepID=A0ABR9CZR0_9GAMM|nr:DUF4062 domain-containing protein [Methylomonas albis]MBD9356338.1 DUF4062 domain-containing protein [Methylomonas albis]
MDKKLQVFISSTYSDLKEERQAAVQAILKAGHIPAGMELFTAGDKSQMETIKRWIDESDIYMLILGGRYGSIEPTTSLSYTELEYDYAVEKEMPLFAVVITEKALDEKVKAHSIDYIERQQPAALAGFKAKVLANISSFFDDAKDIKLTVHETIGDFIGRYKFSGWVKGDQILDSAPLLDEIKRLTTQRNDLEQQLAQLKKVSNGVAKAEADQVNLHELALLLSKIEIETPVFNGSEDAQTPKYDLYRLFTVYSNYIVTGITNKAASSDIEKFLYYNVCTKLQVHGLVKNEKVAGVQWRMFSVTPLGERFLAFADRLKFEASTNLISQT